MKAAIRQLLWRTAPPPGLVVFGDSITVGVNATTSANRWADKLAASFGLGLLNKGISGTVLQNSNDSGGSPRADNGRDRYRADLLGANRRTHYAIQYGLNDLRYTAAPATMNLASFQNDYAEILSGMRAAGVRMGNVILATPTYLADAGYASGTAGFTGSDRVTHEQYCEAVRQLAIGYGCKFADTYGQMRDNGGGLLIDTDNIHPKDAGHAAIHAAMLASAVVTDTSAPALVSATVEDSCPHRIVLTYSKALKNTYAPPVSCFTVSGAKTVKAVSVIGTKVRVDCDSAYANGDTITVSYAPTHSRIKDAAGNLAAELSSQSVTNNVTASPATDADLTAFLSAVTTATGTVSAATQLAVNGFIRLLKDEGAWTALSRANLMCGDAAASNVPVKGSGSDTLTGTTTYAEATGRQTDGTTGFVNTGFTPSTTGGLAVYMGTAVTSAATVRIPIGCRNTGGTQIYRISFNNDASGGAVAGAVNAVFGGNPTGSFPSIGYGISAGFYHTVRRSATDQEFYRNGVSVGALTTSVTASSSGQPAYLFAQNAGGAAGSFLENGAQIRGYAFDSGMTTSQAQALNAAFQAFNMALGRSA